MEYNELSRRGLIKLNGDFDEASKGKLKEYLESGVNTYEAVKPYEEVLATMEESIDKVKQSSSTVNDAMVNHTKKIIDRMMNNIISGIDNIKKVIDEDDNSKEESDNQ